ncbi:uncharacterized protein CANTADRAFT_7972 [Suhomyces tanzawaensis NRRL Y-17324]|uniref:GATA-type domain-containing protein n=1 Tax=Suhomyces tanzawaensis NRRL Y-17324 TaxID=984487 RepID=A0A1E4SDF6_9ASCO|nr:uncharacterized protein CANTADRAFT_7972 [Suhomyces tanzawaensis NRRL Y-17324]ODV77513.1 hypothetical protein CANTADRAFT_7972 [Suhomyces tanzawaensis NRRL Y-17324]
MCGAILSSNLKQIPLVHKPPRAKKGPARKTRRNLPNAGTETPKTVLPSFRVLTTALNLDLDCLFIYQPPFATAPPPCPSIGDNNATGIRAKHELLLFFGNHHSSPWSGLQRLSRVLTDTTVSDHAGDPHAYRKFVKNLPLSDIDLQTITSSLPRLTSALHEVAYLRSEYVGPGHLRLPVSPVNSVSPVPDGDSLPLAPNPPRIRNTRGPYITSRKVSRCSTCKSKDTPEWRKGPLGSRTVCNACGLFYSKLVRKFGAHDAAKIYNYRASMGMIRILPNEREKERIISEIPSL